MIWKQRNANPLCFHRLVWYNYKSYLDREFNVNPKLHAWATNVSQPFLLEYSPELLEMDTEKFNWSSMLAHFAKHIDKGLWKEVGTHKRHSPKTPTVTFPSKQLPDDEDKPGPPIVVHPHDTGGTEESKCEPLGSEHQGTHICSI
jgi:hypothetical protein